MGFPGGFSRVSTIKRVIKWDLLWDPFFMTFVGGGGSLGGCTRCHAHACLFAKCSPFMWTWPPNLFVFLLGPFGSGFLDVWSKCHAPMCFLQIWLKFSTSHQRPCALYQIESRALSSFEELGLGEHSLLVPGLTVRMGGLVATAELATQRSSFFSAFLMTFLQMRRPQHHFFQAWITRLNIGLAKDGKRNHPQRSRQKSVGSKNSRPGLRPILILYGGSFNKLSSERMVGEWMMDPIKIPWFRHPGSSWSLVYLVRGGSRPNLTEGSLSAAMGCVVQGYLIDLGGAIWRLTTRFRGPRVITVYPAVPFDGKTAVLNIVGIFGSTPASSLCGGCIGVCKAFPPANRGSHGLEEEEEDEGGGRGEKERRGNRMK
ncbi:hypothetical protein M5K25_021215 [Dendrobium thyrsiflorum]|uniref:Uncharacterized protein n=1 Tax=Dendrobium thyrsiflorum TaxID=117978 RepID=A0ABD0UIT7_DENTH